MKWECISNYKHECTLPSCNAIGKCRFLFTGVDKNKYIEILKDKLRAKREKDAKQTIRTSPKS